MMRLYSRAVEVNMGLIGHESYSVGLSPTHRDQQDSGCLHLPQDCFWEATQTQYNHHNKIKIKIKIKTKTTKSSVPQCSKSRNLS